MAPECAGEVAKRAAGPVDVLHGAIPQLPRVQAQQRLHAGVPQRGQVVHLGLASIKARSIVEAQDHGAGRSPIGLDADQPGLTRVSKRCRLPGSKAG